VVFLLVIANICVPPGWLSSGIYRSDAFKIINPALRNHRGPDNQGAAAGRVVVRHIPVSWP
jgi:hypothetical protein